MCGHAGGLRQDLHAFAKSSALRSAQHQMTSRPEAKASRAPEHPAEGGNYPLLSIHLHRIGGILRHPAKARNSIFMDVRECYGAHERRLVLSGSLSSILSVSSSALSLGPAHSQIFSHLPSLQSLGKTPFLWGTPNPSQALPAAPNPVHRNL